MISFIVFYSVKIYKNTTIINKYLRYCNNWNIGICISICTWLLLPWLSGQQVVEEILDAQRPGCPREYMNVVIPKDDIRYNPDEREDREMPFIRSRFDQRTGLSPNNPRQQVSWKDLDMIIVLGSPPPQQPKAAG